MTRAPIAIELSPVPTPTAPRKGHAVAWGHPDHPFRQIAFFTRRPHAEKFAAGLRAGQPAHALLLRIWGLANPISHADIGRRGGAARAAAMTRERRQEIGRQAIAARWAKAKAAKEHR